MAVAYVDTSCMVAIAFGEPGARRVARRLESFDALLSSNLLEAELRSALLREEAPADTGLLTWIDWVLPDRPLSPEITRAQAAGYLRGADLWHIATALYVAGTPRSLAFVTLHERQREVAAALGFEVGP